MGRHDWAGDGARCFMRALRAWLPAVVWALLIFGASTDALSANQTGRFILLLLHALLPDASADTLERLHWVVRKAAHFVEYFVFGLLLWRGVRGDRRGRNPNRAPVALAIAASYSLLDEFHQSFVVSRTASLWDCLLDTLGASVSLIILRYRLRNGERSLAADALPAAVHRNSPSRTWR